MCVCVCVCLFVVCVCVCVVCVCICVCMFCVLCVWFVCVSDQKRALERSLVQKSPHHDVLEAGWNKAVAHDGHQHTANKQTNHKKVPHQHYVVDESSDEEKEQHGHTCTQLLLFDGVVCVCVCVCNGLCVQ